MPSLVEIAKQRAARLETVKQADLADFESRLHSRQVDPQTAIPEFEQATIEHYRDLIQSGQMTPHEAHRLMKQKLQERGNIEEQAFSTGNSMYSPSYGGAALSLGAGAGLGWLLGQTARLGGGKPPTFAQNVGFMLSPTAILPGRHWMSFLPLGLSALTYGVKALEDPAYQRGEHGYLGALGSTLANTGAETRRRMSEAEQQYGTVGALPLHALNLAMDPIGAVLAGGSKVKEMVMGKEGEWLEQAETAIDRALRNS